MKNLATSFFFLLLALASQLASAQTTRRVNNQGITGANIYSTLQLAHDAASNGDIIQLEPSPADYGNLTCTKNVTIVGPGYFLAQNQPPVLQASTLTGSAAYVVFATGSSGASIAGVSIYQVRVDADNVVVQRNKVSYQILLGYNNAINNALVRQNYVYTIGDSNPATNCVITNNIITGYVSLGSSTGLFSNNTVLSSSTNSFDNFTVQSNYFEGTFSNTANTYYSYNLFGQATLPTGGSGGNNTANVPPSAVFALAPGASAYDAWYQLKTGTNPARSAGNGGVDIGAFGSLTGFAYRLSGIPAIPAIYYLNYIVNGNSLNLNVSTRSNN